MGNLQIVVYDDEILLKINNRSQLKWFIILSVIIIYEPDECKRLLSLIAVGRNLKTRCFLSVP